jgi:hypothetical protein
MTQTTETGAAWARSGSRPPSGQPAAQHGPGHDRLPVPTRQRRPALAALALVLVLGGAALSGFLVLNSGEKQSVVVVKREMRPGQTFTAADIEEGQVAANSPSGIRPVLWEQASQLVGGEYKARVLIAPGTILTRDMLPGPNPPGENCASTGLNLPEGTYPAEGLRAGDVVRVFYVPGAGGGGNTAPVPDSPLKGLRAGSTLMEEAYVREVRTAGSGGQGGIVASVIVGTGGDKLAQVNVANAAKAVSVVLLSDKIKETTDLERCD